MPLYQMVCIAGHYPAYKHIKELIRESALHIINNGGVVRNLKSLGTQSLPQRMRRHGHYHNFGDYWTMDFDASPRSLRMLNTKMGKDNRVVRWTILKQGEKIEDVVVPRPKTRLEGVSFQTAIPGSAMS